MPRVIATLAALGLIAWLCLAFLGRHQAPPARTAPPATRSSSTLPHPAAPLPGEALMAGYGDPTQPPIEDLRQLQRVLSGYFSVVKDPSRNPIGGNADLTACLLGENTSGQAFLQPDHPSIGGGGEILDRWGTPLFVHPEAARELTLRSAGPDRAMFTSDDLILLPNGVAADPAGAAGRER